MPEMLSSIFQNVLVYILTTGVAALFSGAVIVLTTRREQTNLRGTVKELADLMRSHEIEDQRRFSHINDEFETCRKEFGETGAAIRQKLHENELEARDLFIRRDSFKEVMGEMKDRMGEVKEALQEIKKKVSV